MVKALHEGEIGAVFVVGGGPVGRPDDVELGALDSVKDQLIVLDIMQDELAALARVVLPGCSFVEKTGTLTNVDGRLQRLHKVIEPINGCMDDLEILGRLALHFGLPAAELVPTESTPGSGPASTQAYGGGWSASLQRRGYLAVDDHNKRPPLSRQRLVDGD